MVIRAVKEIHVKNKIFQLSLLDKNTIENAILDLLTYLLCGMSQGLLFPNGLTRLLVEEVENILYFIPSMLVRIASTFFLVISMML